MANASIKAAFTQFWKQVVAHTGSILTEAKSYTDAKTSGFASSSDITSAVSAHNSSASAHSDIRTSITNLSNTVSGKRKTYTATISTTWSGSGPYTQTVSISGILASDMPHVIPNYSTTNATAISQKAAWGCISKGTAQANGIVFTCFEEKPDTAIPIQVEVLR